MTAHAYADMDPAAAQSEVARALSPADRSLSDADLVKLPPVEYDIEGVIPTGGLTYLIGEQNVGKTFQAIDWAIHCGLGRAWEGRQTRKHLVRYLAIEGSRSLTTRVETWKDFYGIPSAQESGVRWHPGPFSLLRRESIDDLIAQAESAPIATGMVVVDTFARATQGIKENDSDGVGIALEALDRIRTTLPATVLVLAHPARGGKMPRGHSSQDGAADAIWVLQDVDDHLTLTCEKQKDGSKAVAFSRTLVARKNSMVIVPLSQRESHALTAGQRTVLQTLRDIDHGRGVGTGAVIDTSKLHKATVYRALKALVDLKLVSAKGQLYQLTPGGLSLVSMRVVA